MTDKSKEQEKSKLLCIKRFVSREYRQTGNGGPLEGRVVMVRADHHSAQINKQYWANVGWAAPRPSPLGQELSFTVLSPIFSGLSRLTLLCETHCSSKMETEIPNNTRTGVVSVQVARKANQT